ncbi:MAG TPA: hypothetical protein PKX91_04900 [Clostridia bacterium]|jgi:predicted transport protein|nr:hypothetical protein [Clostridia bacterium]
MAELNIQGTSKTFEEKLAALSAEKKQAFDEIREALLAKKGVKERVSKKYLTFNRGREQVARISIISTSLRVHLAVNLDDYADKGWMKDYSDKVAYERVPGMVRVSSDLAKRRIISIIETL